MDINVLLALFAGALMVFAAFSTVLQRASLPGPLLCLAFGVLIGPHALDLIRMEDFRVPAGTLLEQAARTTLAVGLAGVALRLPHGYWRRNVRWIALIIGVGMASMLVWRRAWRGGAWGCRSWWRCYWGDRGPDRHGGHHPDRDPFPGRREGPRAGTAQPVGRERDQRRVGVPVRDAARAAHHHPRTRHGSSCCSRSCSGR